MHTTTTPTTPAQRAAIDALVAYALFYMPPKPTLAPAHTTSH